MIHQQLPSVSRSACRIILHQQYQSLIFQEAPWECSAGRHRSGWETSVSCGSVPLCRPFLRVPPLHPGALPARDPAPVPLLMLAPTPGTLTPAAPAASPHFLLAISCFNLSWHWQHHCTLMYLRKIFLFGGPKAWGFFGKQWGNGLPIRSALGVQQLQGRGAVLGVGGWFWLYGWAEGPALGCLWLCCAGGRQV